MWLVELQISIQLQYTYLQDINRSIYRFVYKSIYSSIYKSTEIQYRLKAI